MQWLSELQERNSILFWFGILCLAGGMLAAGMIQFSTTRVLGINAWIKPMKFFLSVWIFSWTMGWLLFELHQPKAVYQYSIMVVIVMVIELGIISWQAANGRLSHFNVSSPLYGMLFSIMGIAIVTLTVWTFVIGLRFFKLDTNDIQAGYLWGIRLGILLFIIFSFQGGIMGSKLAHTIGAADGGTGIPVLNWSRQYGDLRVAHFFGIHALQLLPLLGYYAFRTSQAIIIVAVIYFLAVTYFLVQALRGIPLLKG